MNIHSSPYHTLRLSANSAPKNRHATYYPPATTRQLQYQFVCRSSHIIENIARRIISQPVDATIITHELSSYHTELAAERNASHHGCSLRDRFVFATRRISRHIRRRHFHCRHITSCHFITFSIMLPSFFEHLHFIAASRLEMKGRWPVSQPKTLVYRWLPSWFNIAISVGESFQQLQVIPSLPFSAPPAT